MSTITGAFGLLSGRPRSPISPDGRMALADHLRELRARLIRSALVLIVLLVVAFFFYDQLFAVIKYPLDRAISRLPAARRAETIIAFDGTTKGLLIQFKLCGVAAVIGSSPYWIYQIWAFIVPGLHAKEKRYSRIFAGVAGPLFIGGAAVGYLIMPTAIYVLLDQFTPKGVTNIIEFGEFFTFITRMLLVFGIAFEIPLFVVMLNLVGVVSGKALGKHRSWIIMGTVVFAAVATPSTDPFSMLALAIPMMLLFLLAEVVCRVFDRRRARGLNKTDNWADDEVSTL